MDVYRVGRLAVAAFALLIAAALLLPSLVVIPSSFSSTRIINFPPEGFAWRWYQEYFTVPEWTRASVYSFVVASLSTVGSLAIGIPAAYALVRGQFRFKQAVTLLVMTPLIIPPILIASALFLFLSGIGLIGTTIAVVLGHTLLALPFVTVIVSASLRNLDPSFELAALSLGAPPVQVFRFVLGPLIRPAILTAGLFAFLTSFGEFIVTLFVIGTTDITLPIQLWKGIRFEFNPTIAAAASMLTALTVVVLLLAELSRLRAPRGG